MKINRLRQIAALTLFALLVPAAQAQFQHLHHYTGTQQEHGGIFKDVECLETAGPNGEAIVTVGSDDVTPANGLIAFHDNAGVPIRYVLLTNPNGHIADAAAVCRTSRDRIVACYYDPTDQASDIVCTDNTGNVVWTSRIPDFRVHDVINAPGSGLAQDSLYFTGYTTAQAQNVAVVGLLGGAGAFLFYKEYILPNTYFNTIGFEIAHNTTPYRLTVVGKTSITGCPDGILVLRLRNNGNVVWVKVYNAPNCNYAMKGKALVKTPGTTNNYTLAFEYANPGVPGAVYPGLMEITGLGVINYSHFTTGTGYFNGTNFNVEGMDTDGTDFLISGPFRNGLPAPANSSYTLHATGAGASVQFNEYETTDYWTPLETRLVDLDYFAAQDQYVIGGHYIKTAASVWPISPTNVAFWLISADPNGASVCTTSGDPADTDITPTDDDPAPQVVNHQIDDCPLEETDVDPGYFDQCSAPKRAGNEIEEELQAQEFKSMAVFQDVDGQIHLRIPSEAKGSVQVRVVDVQGRLLQSMDLGAGEHVLDAHSWSAGVYFLQYQGDGIGAGVRKVVVR